MKFTFNGRYIVAQAESVEDNLQLIALEWREAGMPEPKRVHKRHQHKKECPDCHRKFKGKRALGAHRRWRHREVPKLPEMPYIN